MLGNITQHVLHLSTEKCFLMMTKKIIFVRSVNQVLVKCLNFLLWSWGSYCETVSLQAMR